MSPTVRAVMIAVLAGAVASACDEAPAPPPASGTTGAAPAKPAPSEAQIPPDMVSAVSPSKTASFIGVHFALDSAPAVGKPLTVNLAIVPHRPFTRLRIVFETPDAVRFAAGDRFESPENVKPETVFKHKIVVEPRQEGVFLITAGVESESEEGSVIRIYSIPIIVYGAQAPATNPAAPAAAEVPATSAG